MTVRPTSRSLSLALGKAHLSKNSFKICTSNTRHVRHKPGHGSVTAGLHSACPSRASNEQAYCRCPIREFGQAPASAIGGFSAMLGTVLRVLLDTARPWARWRTRLDGRRILELLLRRDGERCQSREAEWLRLRAGSSAVPLWTPVWLHRLVIASGFGGSGGLCTRALFGLIVDRLLLFHL